ncbi:hypothetical protein HJG60_008932 [Phyllostomus discolor]|uniref:Uncharacterized protein n=1 Tax=Phyllostomus discolor TaxID=89673 RepID=A0A834DJ34_9CHIR|nr:hypothetical protein HJG60_008932 [Phyllostomus discolor]
MACTPGMCPDWESNLRYFGLQPELNPLSYTSQGYFFISQSQFAFSVILYWFQVHSVVVRRSCTLQSVPRPLFPAPARPLHTGITVSPTTFPGLDFAPRGLFCNHPSHRSIPSPFSPAPAATSSSPYLPSPSLNCQSSSSSRRRPLLPQDPTARSHFLSASGSRSWQEVIRSARE